MLQRIREGSQGWVAKMIVGAIIVTFALFGAESLVGVFTSGSDDVATDGSCGRWILRSMDPAIDGSCDRWILRSIDLAIDGS